MANERENPKKKNRKRRSNTPGRSKDTNRRPARKRKTTASKPAEHPAEQPVEHDDPTPEKGEQWTAEQRAEIARIAREATPLTPELAADLARLLGY